MLKGKITDDTNFTRESLFRIIVYALWKGKKTVSRCFCISSSPVIQLLSNQEHWRGPFLGIDDGLIQELKNRIKERYIILLWKRNWFRYSFKRKIMTGERPVAFPRDPHGPVN